MNWLSTYRKSWFILLILLTFGWHGKAIAQQYTEYELKAAYLYNFGKFIQWPADAFTSANAPFVIGIYGKDPFGSLLAQTISDKTLHERKIEIVYCKSPEDAKDCHILFVSKVDKLKLLELFQALSDLPVLTVGDDIEDFCQLGGVVNFTQQHAKKRFEINNKAAAKIRLIISSKLLALARIVTEDEIKF